MTVQTQVVVQALLRHPDREHYGLELAEETGLLPGTAYPILMRLGDAGWVTRRSEDIDPHEVKRPRRIYYCLTADGVQQASAAMAVARRPKPAVLRRLAE